MDPLDASGRSTARPSPEVHRYLDLTDAIFIQLDRAGRIALANARAIETLGWPEVELLGRDWFDTCIPERHRAEVRRLFFSLLEESQPITGSHENPVLTRAGTERTLVWRNMLLRDESGRVTGTLSSGADITDQRQNATRLEETLRALEAYQFALDASAIVAITDAKGRIIHVNDKFCEISKYGREELLGQDHRILNSSYHSREFFRNLWSTIRSGRVWRGDIRNLAKDGTFYWVATTIIPFLHDEEGAPQQFIAIRNEITERKLAEAALERTVRDLAEAREAEARRAQALIEALGHLEVANHQIREEQAKLIQAEKLSSIGLLASGVAHEINNPLSGVMACLKALDEGTVREDRRKEYFHTARDGLERIQQIVRGLLDFARQRPPAPSVIDAAEVLDACDRLVTPLTRKKGVELVSSIAPEEVTLRADRSQVMQAIINVLLNAVYASPPGGLIEVSSRQRDGLAGICIADHGPGMSEEVIRRACDPFYTTKPEGEGTGLGLAVTYSIARAHGGDIEFQSREGHGTAVTVWLPSEGAEQHGHSRDPAR